MKSSTVKMGEKKRKLEDEDAGAPWIIEGTQLKKRQEMKKMTLGNEEYYDYGHFVFSI